MNFIRNHGDVGLYENFFYFQTLFFLFSITIVSYTSILPVSQLQTQQLMTSEILSQYKHNVLVLIL